MRETLGDRLPKFSEENIELLKNSVDFVGLNHYTSRFIAHSESPEEHDFYKEQKLLRIGIIKFFRASFIVISTAKSFSLTCFLFYDQLSWRGARSLVKRYV